VSGATLLDRPPKLGRIEFAWARTWVHVVFGSVGPLVALATAVIAWRLDATFPAALAWAIVAGSIVGRLVPDVVVGPNRVRRSLFDAVFPVLAAATFVMGSLAWGSSWFALVLAVALAVGITRVAKPAWFPDLSLEEDVERRRDAERWAPPAAVDVEPRRRLHHAA
jgi:hypothetical protein